LPNADTLDGPGLLAIPADQPERLFSGPDAVAGEFKALAKRWHPDRGGDGDVFAHVNVLWQAAKDRVAKGSWKVPGLAVFTGKDGREKRVRYFREFDAGVGPGYIGTSMVSYAAAPDCADLMDSAAMILSDMIIPDEKLARIMDTRIPKVVALTPVQDHILMVLKRDPESVRARDLLEHVGGKLDPRHVAWVMSDLMHWACVLGVLRLTHNDLSLDTVFINPRQHSTSVVGGWWHASRVGERMARKQAARTVRNAPGAVLASKVSSPATDLTLVRLLGRELLGDPSGMRLPADSSIPKPMADWLRLASGGDAIAEYRHWASVLQASFGARRFIELAITPSDIYGG